ncbi:MAG: hypothetical protein R3251_03770 [Candidatus Spechtbacterales bacterium]|nr:hypothetical protein [Candidatus Spechtbacterales bacterium]
MKIRNIFKLGLMLVIPAFLLVFLIDIVLGTFQVFYPFFDLIHLPKWLYKPVSAVLAVLSAGGVGVILTAGWVDWFFSRIPIIKYPWNRLKAIADRLAFIMQGGYKIVMYSGYHNGTTRERPGIVLGKVLREFHDGTKKSRLVVMQPIPNVFDSLLIPYRDTEVLVGDTKELVLYMATGGIISPPVIKTREWTSAEYADVPDIAEDKNYRNGKDKA